MHWSLRNQLMVMFCGLIVITVAAVSGADSLVLAQRADRRMTRQMESIRTALKNFDFPLTEPVLRQLKSYSSADFVVTDAQGKLFSTSFAKLPNTWFNYLATLPVADDGAIDFDGARYLHVTTTTSRNDGHRVHILYPEAIWRDDRWASQYPHLLVGCLAVALGCGVGMRLARNLSAPIHLLNAHVLRVAQGDFQHVPPPDHPTELRELAGSVNRMVDDLNAMSQAIQRTERLSLIAQLSAGLAHHLRNAIAGANLAIQVHEQKCPGEKESLAVAQRQLRLTEDQIQRLLTAKEDRAPVMEAIDLAEVASHCLQLARPMFDHRRIELLGPACADHCPLTGSRQHLQQLLTELLVNALDAAGEGGWVSAELDVRSDLAILRVSDSGPGVLAALQARIFEPFVTGKPEGIGLGLTAAVRIAEMHGGTLRLLNQRPTSFEVVLPRK